MTTEEDTFEVCDHWKRMRSLLDVVENNLKIAEEDREPTWTLGACEGLLIVMHGLIDYLQRQEMTEVEE